MRPRSKKTKTVNNFVHIPQDLVIEIIGSLPAKSVARFLLVSKLWARIIRGREFIKSFPLRYCSSQPRLGDALIDIDSRREPQVWYLFSPSSSSSTSFLSRAAFPFPNPCAWKYRSHYVNGSLSIGSGQTQFIVSPSTGKSIPLPRVKTRRVTAKSLFGYDSVNDEYKVLCMTEKLYGHSEEPSSQHQVFTLGAKHWKMIECSIPHRPWSNGVCINCVVYYVGNAGPGLLHMSLIRFDLRSENLDLITGVSEDIIEASGG